MTETTITLKPIRRQTTVTVRARLLDNGVRISWPDMDSVKAYIYSDVQRNVAGKCTTEIDGEDDTLLICRYDATEPQYLGVQRLVLCCEYSGQKSTYDKPAFVFVATTAETVSDGTSVAEDSTDVEISVEDVDSSILSGAIQAALDAAEYATGVGDAVHQQGNEDHARADADHSTAAGDHTQAAADHTLAVLDRGTAADDHTRAVTDHTQATTDHNTATADHTQANLDHTQAVADTGVAAADHSTAASDHNTATADHTLAAEDHRVAGLDHTQATTDHNTAAADHSIAATDHTTAAADHTLAGSDHSTAAADHTQALADHAVMAGYDTRLTNVEGEVSQLGQELGQYDLKQNEKIGEMYGGNEDILLDLNDSNTWERITYNASTGDSSATTTRVSTAKIPVPKGRVTLTNSNQVNIRGLAYFWDIDGNYLGYYNLLEAFTGINFNSLMTQYANAYYMAVSLYFADNQTITVSDFLGYVTFSGVTSKTATNTGWKSQIDANTAKANASKLITDKMEMNPGVNLFNPADPGVLIGYYINGSQIYANASYNSSGYIPVTAEKTYYCAREVSSGTSRGYRFVNFYNSQKTLISTITIDYTTSFTTPQNCAFVRITFYAATYQYAQVAAENAYYVPYFAGLDLVGGMGVNANSIATKEFVESQVGNILSGKKWCACGDSFTIGGYEPSDNYPESVYKYQDGPYKGQQIVYPYIIGLRNTMNIVNLAVGGMTMCDIDGTRTNSFTHGTTPRYQQIPLDSDYVTIKMGINDNNYSSPIGTIDDEVVTTFYGAWNVVMKWLTDNLPFAHIGIIITNGSAAAYTDAVIAIAQKWGVAYLDEVNDVKVPLLHRANRSGVSSYVKTKKMQDFSITYTATTEHPNVNTHPNTNAHNFESTFVEDFLRRL